MTKIVQLHRMNSSLAALYTGPQGEIIGDLGANSLRFQDGVTPGGYLLMQGSNNGSEFTNGAQVLDNIGGAPLVSPNFTGTPEVNGDTIVTETAAQTLNDKTFTDTQSIQFGARVHSLSDYEEGIWIPVDASGAGLVLINTSASYVKIGKLVYVAATFQYPATADGSNALISGLPFTSGNFMFSQYLNMQLATNAQLSNVIIGNSSEIFGFRNLSGTNIRVNSDMSNAQFTITGTYIANA